MKLLRIDTTLGRPYAAGVVVADGQFVFVSGQAPIREGQVVDGSIGEQTAAAIENIQAILTSAGAALRDVVKCGVFLADLDQLSEFNDAYALAFGETLPARTTVGAALPGYGVEIDCIAVVPS